MQREMSPAPQWMVSHMQTESRLRCNAAECNAATSPQWKTESGGGTLPHGPEV